MLHTGQAGGCQRHGHGDVLPNHARTQAAVFQIDSDTLPKQEFLKVCFVGTVGTLGPRTGIGIIVKHARNTFFCQGLQVINTGNRGHDVHLSKIGWVYKRRTNS